MDRFSKVSIVMPTYNGEKYIRESIDSSLGQTYQNIQLVVVDDGSTDETSNIINCYGDTRLEYIRHSNRRGIPVALNTGFAKADGNYLTWTSDDNYYAPNAIQKMLSFLNARRCQFVYSDFHRFRREDPSRRRIVKLPDLPVLEDQNCIGPCFVYSRNVKETTGDYDPDTFLAEDYDYWIRVSKRFLMCHLPEPLYFYREHTGSLSTKRFLEIQMANALVKMKNRVSNADRATVFLVDAASQRYPRPLRPGLGKALAKTFLSRKMSQVFRDYEKGSLSLREARLALKDVMSKDYIGRLLDAMTRRGVKQFVGPTLL